jgi:PIN domain nuclease of toxin-antitoxin system
VTNVVLDPSALIAWLRGEPGKEVATAALIHPENQCSIHAINLCEVYYDTLRTSGAENADALFADIQAIGLRVVNDLDEAFIRMVGRNKTAYRISLADSFALALRQRLQGELQTADRHEFATVIARGEAGIIFIR